VLELFHKRTDSDTLEALQKSLPTSPGFELVSLIQFGPPAGAAAAQPPGVLIVLRSLDVPALSALAAAWQAHAGHSRLRPTYSQ
jgi:hypothetical protein